MTFPSVGYDDTKVETSATRTEFSVHAAMLQEPRGLRARGAMLTMCLTVPCFTSRDVGWETIAL